MAQNIQIKVDGKAYAGGLNGNDAAKDFAAKLPLKLKFEDFGSTERISYLPKSLNLGSASRSCDPQKGVITYYIPWGNLAVFVRDFRPSDNLVPLGKLSPEALKAIQESGLLSERYGNNRIFEKNDSFNGGSNADDRQ